MQHSVSPYLISCYNAKYENNNKRHLFSNGQDCKRYMPLDDLMGQDLLKLFNRFLSSFLKKDYVNENKKRLYRIDKLVLVPEKRVIYGYIHKGEWGIPAKVKDSKGVKQPYEMSHTEALMVAHFFYFYIPQGREEGICLLENVGNSGIKALFSDSFNFHYQKLLSNRKLKFASLQYSEIYRVWEKAIANSITITKFQDVKDDVADKIQKFLGNNEQIMKIKLENKFALKDFLFGNKFSSDINKSSPNHMVALWEESGSKVTGEFSLNGKKKIFRLGNLKSTRCQLLIDEDEVSFLDGVPDHHELVKFCEDIVEDIKMRIYK